MKININSLNNIFTEFLTNNVLPKYADIWRNAGESEILINSKLFGYTLGTKLMFKDDIINKIPLLKSFVDDKNNIDITELKKIIIETMEEFKKNGKDIIIPVLNWNLDIEDIDNIFEIAKKYSQGEQNV